MCGRDSTKRACGAPHPLFEDCAEIFFGFVFKLVYLNICIFRQLQAALGKKLRTLEGIREAYVLAWRRSVPKLHRPELENFQTHQVFVIGGGSLVSEITDIFRRHPAGHEQRLRIRQLGRPDDLHRTDNRAIQIDDVPFVVVAYGLTFDAQEVPETFTPNEFGFGDRPTRTLVNWEDM
jgi:hypothetical protein